MVLELDPGRVECHLSTCVNTSEVDGPTGMALEPGWLSEGRGGDRRYFCTAEHRRAFMRQREGAE